MNTGNTETVLVLYQDSEGNWVTVSEDDPLPVTGSTGGGGTGGEVSLDQETVDAIKPLDTQPVTLSTAQANALAPLAVQPVSGNVGVTGTVTVGTHAVTQSGTWAVTVVPSASATGLTPYRNVNLGAGVASIKASSGRVYAYTIHNPTAVTVYAHIYNVTAGSVTPGTTSPAITLAVPAGSTLDGYWGQPMSFATAISMNCTTDTAGGVAPTAGAIVAIGYL